MRIIRHRGALPESLEHSGANSSGWDFRIGPDPIALVRIALGHIDLVRIALSHIGPDPIGLLRISLVRTYSDWLANSILNPEQRARGAFPG